MMGNNLLVFTGVLAMIIGSCPLHVQSAIEPRLSSDVSNPSIAQGFGFKGFKPLPEGSGPAPGGRHHDLDSAIRQSVVSIQGPTSSGSGVVIGKAGNIYTILTAKHVTGGANDQADVDFLDGSPVIELKIQKEFPEVDLVVGTFQSNRPIVPAVINAFLPYPAPGTAELASPELNLRSKFDTVTNKARVAGYSLPSKAITQRIFRVVDAQLIEKIKGNKNGYDLLYQSSTVQGMSGGPVLGFRDCSNGRGFALGISPNSVFPSLLAIHGRSEDYRGGDGRSGVSLGIPIDNQILVYLKSIASQRGIPVGESNLRSLINQHYCI